MNTHDNIISLGKGEYVLWPVTVDGKHGIAFIKDASPRPINTEHPSPPHGIIEIGENDFLLTFDNVESLFVLRDQLNYVYGLMAPPRHINDLLVGAKDHD